MPLSIVFLGSTGFSVRLLEGLCESGHRLAGVVSLRDRPAGRGLKSRMTPLKEAALALPGCEVADWEDVSSGGEWATGLPGDAGLGVVAAFGKILPPSFIRRFPLGMLNVHPSLLPQLRGAAPIQRALMEGHRLTGVSLAFLDSGIDTGDVIDQAELEIAQEDDAASLEGRLAGLALRMLLDAISRLERDGSLQAYAQDHGVATYAPPITGADRPIDWARPDSATFNQVRALSPRPGAYTIFRDKRVKVLKARLTEAPSGEEPGTIEKIGKHDLLVNTSTCSLLVTYLQPEGARVLSAGEFLRGYRPEEGEAFRHG
jgi:methionyl-tRNA formyltransferase